MRQKVLRLQQDVSRNRLHPDRKDTDGTFVVISGILSSSLEKEIKICQDRHFRTMEVCDWLDISDPTASGGPDHLNLAFSGGVCRITCLPLLVVSRHPASLLFGHKNQCHQMRSGVNQSGHLQQDLDDKLNTEVRLQDLNHKISSTKVWTPDDFDYLLSNVIAQS